MDTADLIRTARQRSGLSQRVLAERAGVRRQTVAQVETGARRPSLETLVNLLAAAGLQMRVDLEPLDADVRREIEARRQRGDGAADVLFAWGAFTAMDAVAYRVEGLAAAALLGAPVAVPTIQIALADTPGTADWLVERIRRFDVSVWPDGWFSRLRFDLRGDPQDGAALRAEIAAECPGGRFWLKTPFDQRLWARFAPVDEVARSVLVSTSEGTIAVQPLDEIEAADADAARVLRVMREM